MIARTWRGAVRAEDAEEYAAYIRGTGLWSTRRRPGNRGAFLLHRREGDRSEVLTISFWDPLDSIRGFAGEDVERAVFYPEDDRFLVARDLEAQHWIVGGMAERLRRLVRLRLTSLSTGCITYNVGAVVYGLRAVTALYVVYGSGFMPRTLALSKR